MFDFLAAGKAMDLIEQLLAKLERIAVAVETIAQATKEGDE